MPVQTRRQNNEGGSSAKKQRLETPAASKDVAPSIDKDNSGLGKEVSQDAVTQDKSNEIDIQKQFIKQYPYGQLLGSMVYSLWHTEKTAAVALVQDCKTRAENALGVLNTTKATNLQSLEEVKKCKADIGVAKAELNSYSENAIKLRSEEATQKEIIRNQDIDPLHPDKIQAYHNIEAVPHKMSDLVKKKKECQGILDELEEKLVGLNATQAKEQNRVLEAEKSYNAAKLELEDQQAILDGMIRQETLRRQAADMRKAQYALEDLETAQKRERDAQGIPTSGRLMITNGD